MAKRLLAMVMTAALTGALFLASDDADAKRAGGGSSSGSKGSRTTTSKSTTSKSTTSSTSSTSSTSATAATATKDTTATSPTGAAATAAAPSATTATTATAPTAAATSTTAPSATTATKTTASSPTPTPTTTMPNAGSSRMGGIMGAAGGFLLGGLLGSMLFSGGGGEAAAGGFGLLDMIVVAGLLWLALRWWRQRSRPAVSVPGYPRAMEYLPDDEEGVVLKKPAARLATGRDDPNAGLTMIRTMDERFDPERFLQGARGAFEEIQQAWCADDMNTLRPLLTPGMAAIIQSHAQERKAQGRRDRIEGIRFLTTEISEAWQETGEDWITVRFVVEMEEEESDARSQTQPERKTVRVEEFWTFTRPVASPDPNWRLSAIQQAGE